MSEIALVVVPAFFRNENGVIVEALPQNRLLAADAAPKWEAWRQKVKQMYGWEILISPPSSGSYTRAMFRTPADQQSLQPLGTAAALDASTHQAGRGVDVDLYGMGVTYPDFNETALVEAARAAGFFRRIPAEPWHFDDNPATIYGSTNAAIAAVGNLTAQVTDAIKRGLATPQMAAVSTWLAQQGQNPLLWVGLLLLAGTVYALRETPAQRGRGVHA